MANAALEQAMDSLVYDTQADAVRIPWDDTRITLQQQARTVRIPAEIEAHTARAVHKTQIGLFTSIHHLWVSVDDVLYLWDYAQTGAHPLSIPSTGTIRAVGLVVPRPGVFAPSVTFLVVVATQETIHLVGLEHVEVTLLGNVSTPVSQLRVNLLQGYSVPTDGVPFDRARASSAGRIFLSSSSSPNLFEVEYEQSDGLFRSKCRLVNLTAGLLSAVKTVTRLFAPQSIRLFEVVANFLFVCCEDNALHLYQIHAPDGRPSFTRLCSTSAREIEVLVEKQHLSRMNTNIIHLFPCISMSKALHCMCLTQAGERLHFTMSCSRKQGPGVRGHGPPEVFAGGPYYHFWLSHYSLGINQSAPSAWRTNIQNPPCAKVARNNPQHRQPALYANGVWISGEGPLQLAVRTDAGIDARATELLGVLHVDGEVLAIGEEDTKCRAESQMLPPFSEKIEGDVGLYSPRRSFVLITSTGVQFVHLIYQGRITPQRPPQTARECARCLAMLRNDKSDYKPPVWMWSMEQGEQPSTWIQGLIFFLAVLLHPFWTVPLLYKMPATGVILSWKPEQVNDILASMQCVVAFIRQCQRIAAPATFDIPSSAHRQLQYTNSINRKQAALLRANKLLYGVLCIIDRLIEVLAALKLIHAHKNLSKITQSVCSDAEPKRSLDRLFELRLSDIVGTSDFASISTLCTAFANDVRTREGPDSSTLVDMAKLAPTLYAAAESGRHPSNSQQSADAAYCQAVRVVDVQSCNDTEVHSAARSISRLVHSDPQQALDLCLQKVQEALRQPNGDALLRAKTLFETFLDTTMQSGELNSALLDFTLSKLKSLHKGEATNTVPCTFQWFFDFLLKMENGRGLLVERYGPQVKELCENYLQQKSNSCPDAADALYKFYLKTHQYSQATSTLVQQSEAAEGYGRSYSLAQRIKFLELAKNSATKGATFMPHSCPLDDISAMKGRLEVARRAQEPLVLELSRLAQDPSVPGSLRHQANDALARPELVLRPGSALNDILNVARDLRLPQILLAAADLFGKTHQTSSDTVTTAWIRVFWPERDSPYVSDGKLDFPFILSHPQPFFGPYESPYPSPTGICDLPQRVTAFITELAKYTDGNSNVWYPSYLAPILEYVNCVYCSLERTEKSQWLLDLWEKLPFNLGTNRLLGIYSEMVRSCDTWVDNLQSVIGDHSGYARVSTDNVLVHLSELLLRIAERWIDGARYSKGNRERMSEYRAAVDDVAYVLDTVEGKLRPMRKDARVLRCLNTQMELYKALEKIRLDAEAQFSLGSRTF